MVAPVDDRSLNDAHQEMNRQEQEQPRRRSKLPIKPEVKQCPRDPRVDRVAKAIETLPFGDAAGKTWCGYDRAFYEAGVHELRLPHHAQWACRVVRRVRITLRVAERVMHPMEHRVCARHQKRSALSNECQ